MTSACSGRPRFMLPASSSSNTVRTRRGSSKTRVRETSICRMDSCHQQPWSRSASVSGSGIRLIQVSKNTRSVPACTRSHSSCSRAGSEVAANPLASGVTAMPSASAARRAISCPLHHTLTGYGAYAHTLMNAARSAGRGCRSSSRSPAARCGRTGTTAPRPGRPSSSRRRPTGTPGPPRSPPPSTAPACLRGVQVRAASPPASGRPCGRPPTGSGSCPRTGGPQPGTPARSGPAPPATRSGTRASAATRRSARRLQGRHPAVEVDPVEPLDLQAHVPGDDIGQCDRTLRHADPPQPCLRLRG